MPITLPGNRTLTLYALPGGGYSTVQPVSGLSGGTAAFGWSTEADALADGVAITISTDTTYNFGTRSQARPVLRIAGSTIEHSGTAITAEQGASEPDTTVVWTGNPNYGSALSVDIVTSGLRHSYVDQMYKSIGRGNLTTPHAFDGLDNSVKKNYTSFWVKVYSDFFRTYATSYTSLTGSFQLNSYRGRGEQVSITLSGGSALSGTHYITMVNTSAAKVGFELGTSSPGGSSLHGATVTGLTSGATLVLDSDTGASGTAFYSTGAPVTKMMRVLETNQDVANTTIAIWSHNNVAPTGGRLKVDAHDDVNTDPVVYYPSVQTTKAGSPSAHVGEWVFVEMFIDISTSPGLAVTRVNGVEVLRVELTSVYPHPTLPLRLDNIGMETGDDSKSSDWFGIEQDWGEITSDKEFARVYIANAPTLASATHVELQTKVTSWTSDAIGFDITQGQISDFSGYYVIVETDPGTEIASALIP